MEWSYLVLVAVPVLACVGSVFVRRRRERRLAATAHTVRCPVHDTSATVTVRSNVDAAPSLRHVDVTACSLHPATSFMAPARTAYFADMCPPEPYLAEAASGPLHAATVTCSKACLRVLNAAEGGALADTVRCTAGMNDGMELVRRTQSPAITRIMWHHSS